MSDPERITVSVETLRGELAQLELRIVDRLSSSLAQKADLNHIEQLEVRVQSLELSRAAREGHAQTLAEHAVELEKFKRYRYSTPSIAFLAFLLSAFLVAERYLA